DVDHGGRRVDAHDVDAVLRKQKGEGAGAAADVEHGTSAELTHDGQVDEEVAAIRVEVVVDLGEPWLSEDTIGPVVWPVRRLRRRHGATGAEVASTAAVVGAGSTGTPRSRRDGPAINHPEPTRASISAAATR